MRSLLAIVLFLSTLPANAGDSLEWKVTKLKGFTFNYTREDDQIVSLLQNQLLSGTKSVEKFFGHSFREKFRVWLFPGRRYLDKQWEKDWKLPGFKSECWMVASGVGGRLDILSPLSWKTDACDHHADDTAAVQQIMTHELVHVYHGQVNSRHNFDGMDDLAWFIEGLANYVSGQLTTEKLNSVKQSGRKGQLPDSLKKIWDGPLRYQQAGSLVRYIDKNYGRKKLVTMLSKGSNSELLGTLGLSEGELIRSWKADLLSSH
jgi:hypothetical protein